MQDIEVIQINEITNDELLGIIKKILSYYETDLQDMHDGLSKACFPILLTFFSLAEFIGRIIKNNANEFSVLFRSVRENYLNNINEKFKNPQIDLYINKIGEVRNVLTHNGFAYGLLDTSQDEDSKKNHLIVINDLLFIHPKEIITDSLALIMKFRNQLDNDIDFRKVSLENFKTTLLKRKINSKTVLHILRELKERLNKKEIFSETDSTSVHSIFGGIDPTFILGSYGDVSLSNILKVDDNEDKKD